MLKTERILSVISYMSFPTISDLVKNIKLIPVSVKIKKNVIIVKDTNEVFKLLISKRESGYYISTLEKQEKIIEFIISIIRWEKKGLELSIKDLL